MISGSWWMACRFVAVLSWSRGMRQSPGGGNSCSRRTALLAARLWVSGFASQRIWQKARRIFGLAFPFPFVTLRLFGPSARPSLAPRCWPGDPSACHIGRKPCGSAAPHTLYAAPGGDLPRSGCSYRSGITGTPACPLMGARRGSASSQLCGCDFLPPPRGASLALVWLSGRPRHNVGLACSARCFGQSGGKSPNMGWVVDWRARGGPEVPETNIHFLLLAARSTVRGRDLE